MTLHSTNSRAFRISTIEGYMEWTKRQIQEGWDPYFVNFMYNNLSGGISEVKYRMMDEVDRVYRTLVTNDSREPTSQRCLPWLPLYFGSYDFPIYKKNNPTSIDDFSPNDGRHINGLFFISPRTRLTEPLGDHFDNNARRYYGRGRLLKRIHTVAMSSGDMTDYALKAYKNGKTTHDDILVLPKTLSEIQT